MSTHRFIPAKRKGRGLSFLSMLGGLLITLQLLLTPTAFAASGRVNAAVSLSPQGIVDLAGVSVVRLVISYTVAKPPSTVTCTALGTIIASWPATSAAERNNWVLTDGSILNFSGGSCHPGSKLAGILVYASSEYAGQQSPLMIGQLSCSNPICSDGPTSSSGPVEVLSTPVKGNGGVLFSFHSDAAHMQPFLGLEPTTLPGTSIGVELVGSSGTPPATPQLQATATPQLGLTPTQSTAPSTSTPGVGTAPPVFEPGTPYVDSNGNVAGMQLFGTMTHLSVANIQALENQEVELQQVTLSGKLNSNTLNMQWDAGIGQYEQGHYTQAAQTFQSIQTLNPNFQAASTYAAKANQKIVLQKTATPTANTNQGNQGSSKVFGIIPASWVLVVGLAAGVLVLVLLFLLVSIVFGRRRIVRKQELESFDADVKRARQNVANKETPQQYAQPQPYAAFSQPQPQAQAQPQESYAPPPQSPPQVSPISDVPTVEIPNRNGSGSLGSDVTMPYDVRQLQARNLGLVVVTETDNGIKRKHKPNEDSIFAIQGTRAHDSQPQQFGLFVVADGMGGHANGQDASRLAIQNIIDYILPRISTGNNLDDEGYKNLLEGGVQHANLAVHQRNMEEHADMGTTMTAALVVGATAYVANVGDSRTYLYREPEGLRKITHDHSVVASLVDAGIIKPDDIYTHPKRNQIYRNLGEKPVVEVDSFIERLQPNDKLLLCSDGLWDMVRDPEIQRVLSAPAPSPTQIGKNLIQAALDGGGEDNVSVIVVSITDISGHTGMTGIHLHHKPDSVTVPDLPPM